MRRIDLHVHTTASDGTFTPAQVVELARDTWLSAIAITDHDTVSGYAEAAKRGAELGVEIVPGIEISTKYGGAVHVLGYYIDMESDGLHHILDWIVEDRDTRGQKMAELMAADGLPVSYEAMKERFGAVSGRPHFEKGQKYYVGRKRLPIERAIGLIIKAGGVPVLAHPFQYKRDDAGLRELIEYCIAQGLRGIECYYTGYSPEQCAYLAALADEYGLIKTGGSDFHGTFKKNLQIIALTIWILL